MFSHVGIRERIGRISYCMSRPPWKRSSPFSGWWRDHGTSLQDKHSLITECFSISLTVIVPFKPTQWECWDHRLSFSPSDPSSKLWASGSSVKSPPEYERAFLQSELRRVHPQTHWSIYLYLSGRTSGHTTRETLRENKTFSSGNLHQHFNS